MTLASSRWIRLYLRVLAAFYAFGGLLHLGDVLDLRLSFSRMPSVEKAWILYLLVLDSVAAVGLWRARRWGIAVFLVVAASQLVAYLCFQSIFGPQWILVAFHVVTLVIFVALVPSARARPPERVTPAD